MPEDLQTEEIFVNGERQILARYPNFDPKAQYFDGFAADAISPERAARWADPAGGYFHAMHPALWGDFTWRITGKDAKGEVTKEGGWQNNRGGAVHQKIRFVENIFEELDAPGEWFLNTKTHTLYFYPPPGLDLAKATVEAARLRSLVEFRGTEENPVRFVTLRGLTFRHAARTFMDTKEPLLRTDWAIYRGGAVFFEGTEDCALEDCFLDQVGGNAVFVNHYNRRVTVRGCHIAKAGASGICFVGDPQAARNPLFNYSQVNRLEDLDRTPGPRTRQLSGRLPGGRLPDLPDRARGEADRRSEDRPGARDHRAPLFDLRYAARRNQHRRRLLGRACDRVLRRLRHGEGNRRPRLVQLLGPRPLLAAQHCRGKRMGETGARASPA